MAIQHYRAAVALKADKFQVCVTKKGESLMPLCLIPPDAALDAAWLIFFFFFFARFGFAHPVSLQRFFLLLGAWRVYPPGGAPNIGLIYEVPHTTYYLLRSTKHVVLHPYSPDCNYRSLSHKR